MKTKILYQRKPYRHTLKYWTQRTSTSFLGFFFLSLLIGLSGLGRKYRQEYRPIAPIVIAAYTSESVSPTPSPTPTPNPLSIFVDRYVSRYTKTPGEYSRGMALFHCLLSKESLHDNNKGHGDNGMAGGPMQFWNDTWVRMRKQMMAKGLIEEIGSRYDQEQAVQTAVWQILVNGRGHEWGPILRGECK